MIATSFPEPARSSSRFAAAEPSAFSGSGSAKKASESISQYLLVCHATALNFTHGLWCFSLETVAGESLLDAQCEEDGDLNRLSLLAAVRGLEAIDGQGYVSLISNNRYLIRSLERSLPRWRENNFVWEQFGRNMPVQNADLWKRVDRALEIHCVTASLLQSTRVSGSDSRFADRASLSLESTPIVRVDAMHGESVPRPASNSFASDVPVSDGLRRWLVGNCEAAPAAPRRGQYGTAELVDSL